MTFTPPISSARIHLRYIGLAWLGVLLLGHGPVSYGQISLSESDRQEIRQRAALQMTDLESLLNYIADPSRTRSSVQRHMLSSYSDQDSVRSQIFRDETVIVENDILPVVEDIETSFTPVSTYLNNFFLFYGKQSQATVEFTDLEFSEVRQKNNVPYLVVRYRSLFKGRHIHYPDQAYPPRARTATLQAQYDDQHSRWVVRIAGVSYDRQASPDPVLSADPADADGSPPSERPLTSSPAETTQPSPPVSDTRSSSRAIDLVFSPDLPPQVARGGNVILRWSQPVQNANIILYRGDKKIERLQQNLSGNQWNWRVRQKPGKDYTVLLYDPATNRRTQSGSFRIKPRFPLALKVAVPVAAIGGYLFLAHQNGLFPFSDDPTPGPASEGNRIDIEPRVPGSTD